MTQRVHFGDMPDGSAVEEVTLSGGGLTARVITYGAVIRDLRLDGHQPPLVLGLDTLEDYRQHSSYFGATPGRQANRIGDGRFPLDGRVVQLECNEKGVTHLHGGSDNIAKRNWQIVALSAEAVTLAITDPDGRAGYPGDCAITARYALSGNGTLSVAYEARSDQPTLANLCQHSYFNLDGRSDALDHDLMIAADHYLPTNERQVPTGEIRAVTGSEFDFRALRPMKQFDRSGAQVLFDHNFCLSRQRTDKRSVALVRSISSGVSMEVRTTEPGVQFYAGFKLDCPVPGLEGRRYGAFAGFCLETQVWPDAPNHPDFPNAVLRPGETLRQETDYVFSRG